MELFALGIERMFERCHPTRVRQWRTHLPEGKGFYSYYNALGEKRVVKCEALASPNLDLASKSSISTIPL